jgi:hypothetical protein
MYLDCGELISVPLHQILRYLEIDRCVQCWAVSHKGWDWSMSRYVFDVYCCFELLLRRVLIYFVNQKWTGLRLAKTTISSKGDHMVFAGYA